MKRTILPVAVIFFFCTLLFRVEAQQKRMQQPRKANRPQSSSSVTASFDGVWGGSTGQGKAISFTVRNRAITSVFVEGSFSGVGCRSEASTETTFTKGVKIVNGAFTANSGRGDMSFTLSGNFQSPRAASGSITLHGTRDCPAGEVRTTWRATKGGKPPEEGATIGGSRPMAAPGWYALAGEIFSSEEINGIAASAVEPGVVYATTKFSAYKSADGGKTWKKLPQVNFPHVVAAHPTKAGVVAIGGTEVFTSNDGGNQWTSRRPGMADHPAVVFHPVDPKTIYAGGNHGWGIFKSTDGGGTWKRVLESEVVCCLAIDPTDPQVIYSATRDYDSNKPGGVWKSTDGGNTWSRLRSNSHITALVHDPANRGVLYLGTRDAGVLKSSDSGATWIEVNNGMPSGTANSAAPVLSIAISPANPKLMYAGRSGGGLFRSTDASQTWTPVRHSFGNKDVLSLVIQPPETVYVGTSSGLFMWASPTKSAK